MPLQTFFTHWCHGPTNCTDKVSACEDTRSTKSTTTRKPVIAPKKVSNSCLGFMWICFFKCLLMSCWNGYIYKYRTKLLNMDCILQTVCVYIIYIYNHTVIIRANPSVCPRRRRRHVRTSKNTVFCGTKCTCPWSWLSCCNAQLSYLCVECYNNNIIINIMNNIIIIIIKPLLKIFNECTSLTGWDN